MSLFCYTYHAFQYAFSRGHPPTTMLPILFWYNCHSRIIPHGYKANRPQHLSIGLAECLSVEALSYNCNLPNQTLEQCNQPICHQGLVFVYSSLVRRQASLPSPFLYPLLLLSLSLSFMVYLPYILYKKIT